MPGSEWRLTCKSCAATYLIRTGAAFLPESRQTETDRTFHYEQLTCVRCGSLVSVAVSGNEPSRSSCGVCDREYTRWPGVKMIERSDSPGIFSEVIDGPCPRCGTQLSPEIELLWD